MRRFFLMCLLPIFLATGVFAQPQADEYPYDLTDSSLENNMPDGIK